MTLIGRYKLHKLNKLFSQFLDVISNISYINLLFINYNHLFTRFSMLNDIFKEEFCYINIFIQKREENDDPQTVK